MLRRASREQLAIGRDEIDSTGWYVWTAVARTAHQERLACVLCVGPKSL
jgi:hypothetical protein